MPKFEHDEVKYLFGKAPGAHIVGKHSLDGAFLEIAACCRLGIQQKAVNPILKILAKPSFVRNGEASFFSIEDFAWDATGKSFLCDVLGRKTAHLEVLRQRGCKFENFVVEQRHTELD